MKDQLLQIAEKVENCELIEYWEEVADENEDLETNVKLFLELLIDNEIFKI